MGRDGNRTEQNRPHWLYARNRGVSLIRDLLLGWVLFKYVGFSARQSHNPFAVGQLPSYDAWSLRKQTTGGSRDELKY